MSASTESEAILNNADVTNNTVVMATVQLLQLQ